MSETHGLFVGNLNRSLTKEKLQHGLLSLLTSLGFSSVRKDDVEVRKKHRRAFGFIYFRDADEQLMALQSLSTLSDNSLILISQLQLVAEKKHLKVCVKSDDSHHEHPLEKTKRWKKVSDSEQHQKNDAREDLANYPSSNGQCTSQLPDLLDSSSGPNETQRTPQPGYRTSEYFLLGENLGSESRSQEFKKGDGSFLDSHLKSVVAKYTCAFLNSGGGTLMVGVTDDGKVCGVSCDHRKEDSIRLDIDKVIKGFKPQVFPAQYNVHFTPVLQQSEHGDVPTGRKVLSITVHTPTERQQGLFATPHEEVFVRRDGSVQQLSASSVQEWCRRDYQKDLRVLRDREQQLLRELQDKELRLQEVEKRHLSKSKVCVIL